MTPNTISTLIAGTSIAASLAVVGATIRSMQRRWINYLEDRDGKDRETGYRR